MVNRVRHHGDAKADRGGAGNAGRGGQAAEADRGGGKVGGKTAEAERGDTICAHNN